MTVGGPYEVDCCRSLKLVDANCNEVLANLIFGLNSFAFLEFPVKYSCISLVGSHNNGSMIVPR